MSGLHALFLKFSSFLYHLIICVHVIFSSCYIILCTIYQHQLLWESVVVVIKWSNPLAWRQVFFISYLLSTLQICSLQTFMALIIYKIQKSRTLNSVLTCHSQLCRVVFHLFMVSYDNGFPQPAQWLTN